MITNITGSYKSKREESEHILEFCGHKLLPRLHQNIHVNLELIKNLKKKEGVYGDCIWEDSNHRPREFNIRADSNISDKKFIETIIHEMVHVKQYAQGILYDYSRNSGCRWKRKRYVNWDNYDTHPWELEANKLEKTLAEEYLNLLRCENI